MVVVDQNVASAGEDETGYDISGRIPKKNGPIAVPNYTHI